MIKELFKKDINRQIEGVIKADNLSDEAVFQEVDEYVITKEIHKVLDHFFSEYSATIGKPTQNIGCWISGHFGSGKSHLLKILSYILSSDEKYDKLIKELFLTKIEDDFELQSNIEKALTAPSETILFNIEQKAESDSKNHKDTILSVFMKVFNEMRGYYPKFGYIAKFESDLDKRGKFEAFKQKFKEISGKSWEIGRETILLEIDYAAKALAAVDAISFESAKAAIDRYEATYSLSIEEFAKEVKEYIAKKPKDFRLIFCVDEIGQYIGDNTRLMLNLQTIVETLATECQGQAWVIVTSQSAVSELVQSNAQMENDFSKILGRFKIKLNLTSQNANEVIQKRLLEKKDEARNSLIAHYQKVQNSLRSILRFSDNTRGYKSYTSAEDFANWYPFVPYQLDLFQSSIKNLSLHSIFQGRHQSTGERSMLDVVQTIAKAMADKEVGKLVTFDMFFDGINGIIRAEFQTEINKAADLLDPFSLKVLKTLFMIKYIKEFEATLDNITTLLVDATQVDFANLKEQVKQSLEKLVAQTYIQKVGDIYEYLTDTERDIENEILATEIDSSKPLSELATWLYDEIIPFKKVRYKPNQQDYPFTKKIDGQIVRGKEKEMGLDIITQELSENELVRKSMSGYDLILALPLSYEFEKELEKYLKTQTYLLQKHSANISPQETLILQSKAQDNEKRKTKLLKELKIAFEDAILYYNGNKLDISIKDIRQKLEAGFAQVIASIYPYLHLIEKTYTEADITHIITQSDDLYAASSQILSQAQKNLYGYIQLQKSQNRTLTLALLLEHFSKRPYGWPINATLAQAALLFARGLIELRQNSSPLSKEEAAKLLLNTRAYGNILVLPKKDVKVPQAVFEILQELFPQTKLPKDGSQLYTQVRELAKERHSRLQNFKNLSYPFYQEIDRAIEMFDQLLSWDMDRFFQELEENEDTLLDINEEIVTPLLEFFHGKRRTLYDSIQNFLKEHQSNLRYLNIDVQEIATKLHQPDIYKSPDLQNLATTTNEWQQKIEALLDQERSQAKASIDALINQIQTLPEFQKVPEERRHQIIKPILSIKSQIDNASNIDTIKQLVSDTAIAHLLKRAYEQMADLSAQEVQIESFAELIPKTKDILQTKEDVEEFVAALKATLLDQIEKKKKIIL